MSLVLTMTTSNPPASGTAHLRTTDMYCVFRDGQFLRTGNKPQSCLAAPLPAAIEKTLDIYQHVRTKWEGIKVNTLLSTSISESIRIESLFV